MHSSPDTAVLHQYRHPGSPTLASAQRPCHPGCRRAQEFILHALSQPRPHTALEAEVAEQHATRAAPGALQHAANMKRVRSVSRAMCATARHSMLMWQASASAMHFLCHCAGGPPYCARGLPSVLQG